ncbi:MAG: hypothetical protein ACI9AD_000635, partial [Nitriliruptoraceae bacterium]
NESDAHRQQQVRVVDQCRDALEHVSLLRSWPAVVACGGGLRWWPAVRDG